MPEAKDIDFVFEVAEYRCGHSAGTEVGKMNSRNVIVNHWRI